MTPPQSDLDRLIECLKGIADEHRTLLDLVRRHEAAMRSLDSAAIDDLAQKQEQVRTKIMQWEARRRMVVATLVKASKMPGEPTLTRLAAAFPTHRAALMKLKGEIVALATEIRHRTGTAGRIAQAMLGHLNTAVRLLAGAVERGGTYTRQGTPKLTRRIGSIEAVG